MLNAISKSAYLPPYDPYFAGGTLNYYYYGLYMVSLLGKLVGLSPEISFNLAVPTFFGLTVSHAFVVGRMVLGTGRLRVWQGVCAAACVALVGNLSGARQYVDHVLTILRSGGATGLLGGVQSLLRGLGAMGSSAAPSFAFDYWYASTRIIPYTINEFPFFTFLFADLHPHLIAMPFGLLVLALCGLALRVSADRASGLLALALILVLTLGMLGVTNTWDLPIYLLISGATLVYLGYRRSGVRGLLLGVGFALGLGLASLLAYAPFYASFRAQSLGLALVSPAHRTTLGPFLEIWGLFLWLLAGGLVWQVRRFPLWRSAAHATAIRVGFGVMTVLGVSAILAAASGARRVWPVLVFLLVLAGLTCLSQWKRAGRWYGWLLVTAALGLLSAIEWVYVADFLQGSEWLRMNTVFKFSLQAWVLLGVSLGAFLPVLWQSCRGRRGPLARFWSAGLVLLGAAVMVYPVASIPVRVEERFPSGSPQRNTLDGTAYMVDAVYDAPGGSVPVEMRYDREALVWMWEHVQGTPVLAEAPVGFYREGGLRISSYTGLPTVVGAHQYEQRPPYQVAGRQADAELLYNTEDPVTALGLIRKHQYTSGVRRGVGARPLFAVGSGQVRGPGGTGCPGAHLPEYAGGPLSCPRPCSGRAGGVRCHGPSALAALVGSSSSCSGSLVLPLSMRLLRFLPEGGACFRRAVGADAFGLRVLVARDAGSAAEHRRRGRLFRVVWSLELSLVLVWRDRRALRDRLLQPAQGSPHRGAAVSGLHSPLWPVPGVQSRDRCHRKADGVRLSQWDTPESDVPAAGSVAVGLQHQLLLLWVPDGGDADAPVGIAQRDHLQPDRHQSIGPDRERELCAGVRSGRRRAYASGRRRPGAGRPATGCWARCSSRSWAIWRAFWNSCARGAGAPRRCFAGSMCATSASACRSATLVSRRHVVVVACLARDPRSRPGRRRAGGHLRVPLLQLSAGRQPSACAGATVCRLWRWPWR